MNTERYADNAQPTLIERISLLEKLGELVHRKLTLVIAPPGYGKTTLVSQYVGSTDIPSAWLTLEKRDQDLPVLLEHILNTLSQVVPEIRAINPAVRTTAGELAALTGECLRDYLTTPLLLIIDDVHQLLEATDAKVWLNAFIAVMPKTCHLILIGQALPVLQLSELIARRKIVSIGQKELSLSLEEIKHLAQVLEIHLIDGQLEKIFSQMQGWPAGTLLALQPLPDTIEQSLFGGEKGPEAIFYALAEQLFSVQPPSLQAFLLSSSSLSRITPSLCQNALHLNKSLEHLMDALQRNLFITEIPGGMVYHSLFRHFLQERLRLHNPEQFKQHHRDAGEWFEAENRLDEAFEHYIAARALDKAVRLTECAALPYYTQGKIETLLEWQQQFEESHIREPKLLHACAMIHRDRYAYVRAMEYIAEAEAEFKANNDQIGLIQVWLLKGTIDNQLGHYQAALEIAEKIMTLSSVPENLLGYALAIAGTAYLHLGNLPDAVHYLEKALPLWRDTGDIGALAQLLMTLQSAYFRIGRYSDTEKCLQEVVTIRRSLGSNIGMVMALNNLGYHYHLLGAYNEAMQTFQEGIEIAKRFPENRSESYLLWSLGDLQRDCSAFTQAIESYNRSLQLTGSNEPFLRASVLVSLATLKRWQHKADEAYELAVEAKQLAQRYELSIEHLKAELAIWAVRIQQGDDKEAITQLERLIDAWKQHQSLPRLFQTLGIRAHAALLNANSVLANQFLHLAVETFDHPANLQPLIAEIVHTPLLKSHILDSPVQYKVLVEGVKRLEAAQIVSSVLLAIDKPISTTTYSLRIRTLGEISIERDGTRIPLLSVKAAATREMFFYLLIKGPASREQLGLVFWPDSSSQQLRRLFHTTLDRMRKGLGSNIVSFQNDVYAINPDIDVWCDVFAFENLVQQAKLTSPLTPHAGILWQSATELYRGDFLSGLDGDWVTSYRELLHQTYIDSLHSLGNCLRLRGNTHAAVTTLKRAIEHDPLREDIHRSLFTCYADLGEQNLIVRQLDELTILLDREIGVSPSTDTVTFAQSLLS